MTSKYKAKSLLWALRQGNIKDAEDYIRRIKEGVTKRKYTFKDLGTNKKELNQWLSRGYYITAKYHLYSLRENPRNAERYIGLIHESIAKGKLSLESIGTDEQELNQFRQEIQRFKAMGWVESLRKDQDPENAKYYIKYITKFIVETDYILKDIGTNEDELQGFLT